MSTVIDPAFDKVFPKGKNPEPASLHPLGSIVSIEQCPPSIWKSDPGGSWLDSVYRLEYEEPCKSMGLLLVRDRILVPDHVEGHSDVNLSQVQRLRGLLEPKPGKNAEPVPGKPVIWFPGLRARAEIAQALEYGNKPPRLDSLDIHSRSSTDPALMAAHELGLKEIPVYRPVTPKEIRALKSAGIVQRVSNSDVSALGFDDDQAENLKWLKDLMPHQTIVADDPRFDFMHYRFSQCFLSAVHGRSWNTVNAVLDHWNTAGGEGVPLHPQASRHAPLKRILQFIAMTAAGDDRVDVLARVHKKIAPMGIHVEEFLYQGVAKFGRKDPELDQAFARLSPHVRAWMSAQASLMAIKRITAPHRIYPKVPKMGACA